MKLLIGTSGFIYEDWRGYFYPVTLPKREMLAYYAAHFPTVEVNATYYSLPHPATFEQMSRKVPPDFSFVVKAHKEMTHSGGELHPEAFSQFRRALEPLLERGNLGCVLAQFPWSFRYGTEQQGYLREFREQMGDVPTVVEFRNAEWAWDVDGRGSLSAERGGLRPRIDAEGGGGALWRERQRATAPGAVPRGGWSGAGEGVVRRDTADLLRELGLGFCCVDEPRLKGLMPPVVTATSPIGYVRFHGRNAAKWWQHEHAYERYDYLYTEEELSEWVPRIERLAAETERTYLFFNNHYQGKAGQNAQMLARLLNLALPLAVADPSSNATA